MGHSARIANQEQNALSRGVLSYPRSPMRLAWLGSASTATAVSVIPYLRSLTGGIHFVSHSYADCPDHRLNQRSLKMDSRKLTAEAIGTFWLTFGGCGSAVIAAGFPHVGIGLLGVSFAFGLTLLTMAYAIGHVSGCHINPAVTIGLAAGGRFPLREIGPYIV